MKYVLLDLAHKEFYNPREKKWQAECTQYCLFDTEFYAVNQAKDLTRAVFGAEGPEHIISIQKVYV